MSKVFLRKAVSEFLSSMGKYGPADWQRNTRAYHLSESVRYIMRCMCSTVDVPTVGSIHELKCNLESSERYSGEDVHMFLSKYLYFTRDYLALETVVISEKELREMVKVVGEFLLRIVAATFDEDNEEASEWTYWITKCLKEEGAV